MAKSSIDAFLARGQRPLVVVDLRPANTPEGVHPEVNAGAINEGTDWASSPFAPLPDQVKARDYDPSRVVPVVIGVDGTSRFAFFRVPRP
jgi:hypothetical protein